MLVQQGEGRLDLVIVWGDTHIGSTRGVRVPHFVDRDGETHDAPQAVIGQLWRPWCKHWKDVGAERDRLTAAGWQVRVVGVYNGDGPDRNFHDLEGFEQVVQDWNSIIDLCERTLAPALDVIDVWVINRGTPAHEGRGSGGMMEALAERIAQRARVWHEGRALTQYWPRLILQGVDVLFGHHPPARSRLLHTRQNAAARTAVQLWMGYCSPLITANETIIRGPVDAPALAFFGHCHYDSDSGVSDAVPLRVFYTAAWQLPYSYVYQLGGGIVPNHIGSRWLWCANGEYECKHWLHSPPRATAVELA